jgi:hypothetical protein
MHIFEDNGGQSGHFVSSFPHTKNKYILKFLYKMPTLTQIIFKNMHVVSDILIDSIRTYHYMKNSNRILSISP